MVETPHVLSQSTEWGSDIVTRSTPKKRKSQYSHIIEPKEKELIRIFEDGLEKSLTEKAAKSNLSQVAVKSILKYVVTDENVLALLKQKENDGDISEVLTYEPKVTRSRAKELSQSSLLLSWDNAISKDSKVHKLLSESLQEESTDDEYLPVEEESEDDSSFCCTISNPPTPSSKKSNHVEEEIFKTPKLVGVRSETVDDECHQSNEDTNIALRTRSKLSLSETPLEKIEQSFIPPDITNDMYELECNDDDWRNFLNSFAQPLDEVVKNNEEEDLDPEYNILSDEEITKVDTEELRDDRAVRVPRKELNELIAELFEYVDVYENRKDFQKDNLEINMDPDYYPIQQLELDRYIEIFDGASNKLINLDLDEHLPPLSSNEPLSDDFCDETVRTDNPLSNLFSKAQFQLLQQQMCQHVQMLTQNFLLTFNHPYLNEFALESKEYLLNFKLLSESDESSSFHTLNLEAALDLMNKWEQKFEERDPEALETIEHFEQIMEESIIAFNEKKHYYLPFPDAILKTISESKVFLYPQLLPKIPFKHPELQKCHYAPFSNSEYQLVALGLEQFIHFLKDDKEFLTRSKRLSMIKIAEVIHNILMLPRKVHQIYRNIKMSKNSKNSKNPISFYFKNKRAPFTVHQVIDLNKFDVLPPQQRPAHLLPRQWRAHIHHTTLKFVEENQEKNIVRRSLPETPPEVLPLKQPTVYRPILPKAEIPKSSEPAVKVKKVANKNLRTKKPKIRKEIWVKTYNLKRKFMSFFRKTVPYLQYVYLIKTHKFLIRYFPCQKIDFYIKFSKENYMASLGMLPSMPCLDFLTVLQLHDEEIAHISEPTDDTEKASMPVDSDKERLVEGPKQENVYKDNIQDVNALLIVSSTVKNAKKEQSLVDKKRAKKRKEYLASIAMLTPQDSSSEKDKRERFSQAYMTKLKEKLGREEFNELLNVVIDETVKDAVDLYRKLTPILSPKYQDLADEFLLFLTAEQACAVGQLIPFFIMNHMAKFLRNLELYFRDQPSQLRRVYKSLQDLNDTPEVNLERIKSTILPLLKGNPLLCDSFLQLFLEESPTSTLLSGAWDVVDVNKELNKAKEEGAFENIAVADEDSACTCNCHKIEDLPHKYHCNNCGLKFLQGKIYMQTSRGMKPVNVSFPLDPDVDHNARLAAPRKLKRILPNSNKLPILQIKEFQSDSQTYIEKEADGRRRKVRVSKPNKKTTPNQKAFLKKDESKENPKEDGPKSTTCNKNSTRRKLVMTQSNIEKMEDTECADVEWKNLPSPEYISVPLSDTDSSQEDDRILSNRVGSAEFGIEEETPKEIIEKEEARNEETSERWTKDEDRILLETFKQNFHKDPISLVKQRLGNRSEQEIISRFDNLMNLLQEMYSGGDSKLSTC